MSLHAHPLFDGVAAGHRSSLVEAAVTRELARGQALFRPGEPAECAYLLCRGVIRAWAPWNDLALTTAWHAAPASLGLAATLVGNAHHDGAIAVERCSVMTIRGEDLRRLQRISGRFAENLALALAQALRDKVELVAEVAFAPTDVRVARLLLTLVERFGAPTEGGQLVRLRLTHEDMAEALGLAKKSIARALSRLRVPCGLTLRGGRIVVRDLAALRRATTSLAPTKAWDP
jgi:CRP-like cAMP-binding protein